MQRLIAFAVFLFVCSAACQNTVSPTENLRTAADHYNRAIERHSKGDFNGALADHSKAIEQDDRKVII